MAKPGKAFGNKRGRSLAVFEGGQRVFALFGNPVGHSLSPLMHHTAYGEMRIKALYVPFCVRNLEDAVRGIRGMDIGGVSVTIPFKSEVLRYLDELEESASRIGAVNTIVNKEGRLYGHNTDWIGFGRDLKEFMPIQGKTFGVLGAGGAARAVLFGVLSEGGNPVVLNRTAAKGEALAKEFGCSFLPLSEIGALKADCIVNTTSVGMAPQMATSPLEAKVLGNFPHIVDIIYNPLETKLLKEARKAGCRTRSGLGMFIQQGAEQIKLWTGMEPPVESMKRAVREKLEGYEKN
jgi:shikimate dehydrogenase